jgi:hypothetical protein
VPPPIFDTAAPVPHHVVLCPSQREETRPVSSESFAELPAVDCWRLQGAYEGFEVVRFAWGDAGGTLEGTTVGIEEGVPWTIHYVIEVSSDWHVRRARLTDYAGAELLISTDGVGTWTVGGERRPEQDACLDLDLEASVVTNTLPVHRLALPVGERGESAAAYIRTIGLAVERLDQTYRRLPDADGRLRFDYESPRFGYRDTLHFGPDGLAVDYPGIGVRVASSG